MFFRFLGLFCAFIGVWTAFAGEVRIPVVASGDIHGDVAVLSKCVVPALAEIRRKNGVDPIYCDLGDTAEGSFAMWKARGAGALTELHRAGAEIWVPGNHEISFGLDAFAQMLQEFRGTVLAANLVFPQGAGRFQSYLVVERAGFRIAFIGLMLKNMNSALPVSTAEFQTLAALTELPKILDEVRRLHPDAIVLLRHAGLYGGGENLSDVLKNAPGVDLVIGAHTHTGEAGRMVRSTWYVQPGAHGESLAEATLIFDEQSRKLKQIESHLVLLNYTAVPTPEERAAAPAVTGESVHYIANRMKEALNADAALYAIGNKEAWQKLCNNPTPTVADYFAVFPYFDPVVCAEVSAMEIKAILAEYVPFAAGRKMTLSFAGGKFTAKSKALDTLKLEKSLLRYRLAVTMYVAAGAGGKLPVTKAILAKRIDRTALNQATPLLDILLKKYTGIP